MDEWINKVWSIHTMESYSVIKRQETLTQATAWMNLEATVLSERSQTQKDTYCVTPFTGNAQNTQIPSQKEKWVPGPGEGRRGS